MSPIRVSPVRVSSAGCFGGPVTSLPCTAGPGEGEGESGRGARARRAGPGKTECDNHF
ncbi:hypothetical protein [Streptomyces sp. NPDC058466]|uniref:hypothetical protein n=1 Tax=Streptomyces sp. NPDC058466 TaxID=3346512 RepID=UPI00364B24AF